jgi:hypothetical protein
MDVTKPSSEYSLSTGSLGESLLEQPAPEDNIRIQKKIKTPFFMVISYNLFNF